MIFGTADRFFYALNMTFGVADNATLVNGQLLDSKVEGRIFGDMTIRKAGVGPITDIVSGELKLHSAGNYAEADATAKTQATMTVGQILYVKFRIPSGVTASGYYNVMGVASSTTPTANSNFHSLFYVRPNNAYLVGAGATLIAPKQVWAADATYQIVIMYIASNTFAVFLHNGTNWDLLCIHSASVSSNTYSFINSQGNSTSGNDIYYQIVRVPFPAYSHKVVALATMTNETAVTAAAEVLFFGTFTAVTGQTLQLDYRRDSGGNNSWRIKIAQGTTNNLTLRKYTTGSEGSALATASLAINNGTSYEVMVVADGTNWHKVYVNKVLQLSYTTTDTHMQNETGAKLTLGTISTVSISAYNRTGYDFGSP